MKAKIRIITFFILLLNFSCKKQDNYHGALAQNKSDKLLFPERGTLIAPKTPAEIRAVELIKSVTPILLEVYKNPLARREVNAAIYSGFYEDESVMLKDLIDWQKSPVYNSSKFKSVCMKPGVFSSEFKRVLQSREPLSAHRSYFNDHFIYNNIAIYFPYSDFYQTVPESEISILPAEFEGNYGIGFEPTLCVNEICYDTTTIDDYYAALENPTHIITVGPLEPVTTTPNSIDSIPQQPQPQLTVYWGWMRQNSFLDPLISFGGTMNGGGNEVNVNRTSAYLRTATSGDITDFSQPSLPYKFTRGEIANRRWKKMYSVWDPSWEIADFQQVLSVWEEDNATEVEKGGTFTTTVSIDTLGISLQRQRQLTFKLKYRTKNNSAIYAMAWSIDDYIRITRDQFSSTGYNLRPTNYAGPSILGLPFAIFNQTGQTKDGSFLPSGQYWPIMEPGIAVGSWVWPHRIF